MIYIKRTKIITGENRVKTIGLCLGSLLLISCAQPYKPYNKDSYYKYGYSDTKLDDFRYRVSYKLAVVDTIKGSYQIKEFWHRRADELCKHKNYHHLYEKADSKGMLFELEGVVTCQQSSTESKPQ